MRIFKFEIKIREKSNEEVTQIHNIDRNSYIDKSLNEQIKWYEINSKKMKNKFCFLSVITIIVNAIIPIFVLLSEEFDFNFKVIVILLSSIATINTSILQLFKYQEIWIRYRITSQYLKKEKISYETQTGRYKDKDKQEALELLIETCQETMVIEYEKWQFIYDSNSN